MSKVEEQFYKCLGPFNLVELLDGLDVSIPEGQFCDIEIVNAAPVNKAQSGEISYFEGKKNSLEAIELGAEACLVSAELAALAGRQNTLAIISKTPRADFARILSKLYVPLELVEASHDRFTDVKIAKSAVISQSAKIGAGTVIGPNSVIGPGVEIGEACRIGANVVIEFARVGNRCQINHGVIIGGSGFGVAAGVDGGVDIPHVGAVTIGDDVSIGCQTTIDRSMFGATEIGQGCKFDNFVQIAHNVKIGPDCMFAAQVGISGSTIIGAGVIMGGQAGIADHLNIGNGAMLAANSGLMHDIPAGEKWSGYPAMPIRQHMRQIGTIKKLVQKKPKPDL